MTKSTPLLIRPFRSLRQCLTVFVLTLVLPSLLLALALGVRSARQLVEAQEQHADHLAAAAAGSLGNHLRTMSAGIAVLANMPLGEADRAAFYQVAKGFSEWAGCHVTLADPDGNQFLSTRLPFGTPPPRRSAMESVKKAVAAGRPNVSEVFAGKMAGRHVITIDAPVRTPEGLRLITLSVDADRIAAVLFRTAVPDGVLLGLLDGRGNFIARSKDSEQWVGKPAGPELIDAARRSERGMIHNASVEGFPILSVFHRVPDTDWTVLVGIPESVLYAPLVWPIALLAGLAAAVIGLSALFAYRFARQLNLATDRLIAVSREASQADETPAETSFTEFDEIAAALRNAAANRQQFAAALDLTASMIRDTDGTIRHWTTGCVELYGWTGAEAVGRVSHELLRTQFPVPRGEIEARVEEHGEWTGELIHTRKDGTHVRVSAHWKLHRPAPEQSPVVVETVHDVAAERRLALALGESEARFQVMADTAPVMIWVSGVDKRCCWFNRPWLEFTGRPLERELGDGWAEGVHADDCERCLSTYVTAFDRREPFSMEYRLRRHDGVHRWLLDRGVPRFAADGSFAGYVGSCIDISDLKLAESTLRASRDELETRVAERTDELVRANAALSQEIDERRRAEQALQQEKAHQAALIRKLEDAQNQLLQSEKMASIGQLAAGVAHEINNPIGFVASNLVSLQSHVNGLLSVIASYERWADPLLATPGPAASALAAAKDAAELDYLREDLPQLLTETLDGVTRVRNIVRDLKEFSHVSDSEWLLADLHKGLDSTLNVVWNELKYKARVVKEYGELPAVECMASRINQVFMNLLVNAAHAIAETGVITLRTGRDGEWVWVEVADTGSGIAPENLLRIFEPFFTTKPVGKGTGLGLSMSYGIVRQHGGRIEVASAPGQGTRFRVWLPVIQSTVETVPPSDGVSG